MMNFLWAGGFSVAFDPLDGSSIVRHKLHSRNHLWCVAGDKLARGHRKNQIAAAMGIFGPRTTYVLALKDALAPNIEFPLLDEGLNYMAKENGNMSRTPQKLEKENVFLKFEPHLTILIYIVLTTNIQFSFQLLHLGVGSGAKMTKGGSSEPSSLEKYILIDYYVKEKYTLRYTGGMVPNVNQIIVKEKGIFTNVTSPSAKAKLRLLFEVAPLGFLIEKAGGYSSDGKQSVLDKWTLSGKSLPISSSSIYDDDDEGGRRVKWTEEENKKVKCSLVIEKKERCRGQREEHRRFLMGLEKYGKGDWRNISRNFVISKTPTQVASHAQKYYLRQIAGRKDKRRPSIMIFFYCQSQQPYLPTTLKMGFGIIATAVVWFSVSCFRESTYLFAEPFHSMNEFSLRPLYSRQYRSPKASKLKAVVEAVWQGKDASKEQAVKFSLEILY
ncbi:hypothetical protein HAX54_016278 [Datura stramonium]|uniref:HTH myb-type domain-containing protein n=1 Tax=Datura stramonium TaxID=4076 RepID=A0ABS8RZU0_DATST|nr:hypothetical protein [Datura stramonium]